MNKTKEQLKKEYDEAWDAWKKSRVALEKAREARNKATEDLNKAIREALEKAK